MFPKPSKGLYVTDDAQFVLRDDICHEDISPNELLIETHYSGINPADIRHATHLGIRATVLGYDFSGCVIEAPSSSKFMKGDVVAGYTPSGLGRPTKYGSHQSYLAVPDDMVFRVPPNLPEAHAAALTVVVMTAADVLYNLFKFPLPTSLGTFSTPILIWGASSAVGLSAVQLARASGFKNVFVTASPARHELLRSLGATKAFDYSSPTVVDDIVSAVAALRHGPITHALDAVGSMGSPSSSDLLAKSVGETTLVASVILRQDARFMMPVAMTKDAWKIQPLGAPAAISIPARPAHHWNAWKALQWVVTNYGTAFELPSVHVKDVTAPEALGELFKVAEGKQAFGKVVLQHPFK